LLTKSEADPLVTQAGSAARISGDDEGCAAPLADYKNKGAIIFLMKK
jgi:hypothetical protein